jgi:putative membrane protein
MQTFAFARWGIGAAILAGPAAATAHAGPDGSWGHPGMPWGGGMGWFMGPILMIVLLVAAVAGAVVLVRWLGGANGSPRDHAASADRSALRILEERFARGEIDEEEFRRRREALGG